MNQQDYIELQTKAFETGYKLFLIDDAGGWDSKQFLERLKTENIDSRFIRSFTEGYETARRVKRKERFEKRKEAFKELKQEKERNPKKRK